MMLGSCGEKKGGQKDAPVINVVTEPVSASSSYVTMQYVGQVEALSSTAVSFPSGGTLRHIFVEEGQRVSKGQLIAEMDATTRQDALRSAEAALRQARDAHDRMRQLYEAKGITEMQWVEAESRLQQAEANCDIQRKQLADCRVVAPVSGMVGAKMADAGETVMPGQPVCTLLDVSTVRVRVAVPEKEIGSIGRAAVSGGGDLPSTTVTIEALGGETFTGRRIVKNVATGSALAHTYDVLIDIPNPHGRILPGMVCSVSFPGAPTADSTSITVPINAIQSDASGQLFVWTVKNGQAQYSPIITGQTRGSRIVVLNGLSEGDQVVTAGYQKLSEGSSVNNEK